MGVQEGRPLHERDCMVVQRGSVAGKICGLSRQYYWQKHRAQKYPTHSGDLIAGVISIVSSRSSVLYAYKVANIWPASTAAKERFRPRWVDPHEVYERVAWSATHIANDDIGVGYRGPGGVSMWDRPTAALEDPATTCCPSRFENSRLRARDRNKAQPAIGFKFIGDLRQAREACACCLSVALPSTPALSCVHDAQPSFPCISALCGSDCSEG